MYAAGVSIRHCIYVQDPPRTPFFVDKNPVSSDDPRARANAGHFALRHLPPHRYPKSKLTLNPNQLRKLKITVILTLNFADFAVAIPNVSFLFTHNFQRNPKALNITHNPNGKN